jgi:hypothetical protein
MTRKRWKPVTDDALTKFEDELNALAERTFGVNEEGSCPITVSILDRSRFEYQHWLPVPYPHKAKTDESKREIRDSIYLNLMSATEAFERWVKMQWFHEREKKK